MATRKFRFVSPGVFLKEIDLSQLPGQGPGVGPVLIGRTRQGPSLKPYKVQTQDEFNRVFGLPMPGNEGRDPWRDGTDLLGESYLPYAAKAYLSANIDSPITVVRLAGISGEEASASVPNSEAGWAASNAYGLFVFTHSGSATPPSAQTADLAAIFYGTTGSFSVKLRGQNTSGSNIITANPGTPVHFSSQNRVTFQLTDGSTTKDVVSSLEEMREEFNTNPVMSNDNIANPTAASLASKYWLGETFEETASKLTARMSGSSGVKRTAVIMKLASGMEGHRGPKHQLGEGRTGWVIAQDTSRNAGVFDATNNTKLFRLVALQEGSEASRNVIVGIEDIKVAREGALDPYGEFSVVVKRIEYGTGRLVEVERFDRCNLNPKSDNFIAKAIGDQYFEWHSGEKRNKLRESNPNISEYIRVQLDADIQSNGLPNKSLIPFGFFGPVQPKKASASVNGSTASGVNAAGGFLQGKIHLSQSSSGSINFQWPEFPSVCSGSLNDQFYLGATPYLLSRKSGARLGEWTTTEQINEGYVDHTRRMSELNGLATDQDDGVADGSLSEHSWAFSMDEVVVSLSQQAQDAGTTVLNISRNSDVGDIVWKRGSKTGRNATAVITFTAIPDGDDTLILTDANLVSGTYIVVAGQNHSDGSKDSSGRFRVGRAALADLNAFVNRLATVINAQTDQALTALAVGPVLTLTQDVVGIAGQTSINATNFTGATVTGTGFVDGGGTSYSAVLADNDGGSLRPLLNIIKGFHMPLLGGFDGTNITEANPFNNDVLQGKTSATSYAYASVDRAIELIRDAEVVEHNLAAMPGITNTSLTTKLVNTCEARADSLAIIDLPDVYVPPSQRKCTNFKDRVDGTTPELSAAALVKRQINSSYGTTYYPWLKIRDTRSSRDVWVPPSVIALGVMAYTEQRDAVWFAPAGFNRGGLNQGNAGLPVLQTSEQLMSKDRDTLYEANINPIASFVSEGIVVFGQKTLQSTQSALDRINVRRLLIFIKKEVSRICSNLLFDQNVPSTWSRFTGQVVPLLEDVKVRFGLSDFKVILDESTTTPDLVDRNIMYAKIFLKPARSIEFIAVDFIITSTGAEFDD